MKVYLAIEDYGLEGYGAALGVFSSREAAEQRAHKRVYNDSSFDVDILEFTLDSTEDFKRQ